MKFGKSNINFCISSWQFVFIGQQMTFKVIQSTIAIDVSGILGQSISISDHDYQDQFRSVVGIRLLRGTTTVRYLACEGGCGQDIHAHKGYQRQSCLCLA